MCLTPSCRAPHSGITHLWPDKPVFGSDARATKSTGSNRFVTWPPCGAACPCFSGFYFRVHRGGAELSWMSSQHRCASCFHAAYPRRRAIGGGETHAVVSPGPALLPPPQEDHAHEGEVGSGQFHGRDDGRRLQRRPSRRLGSAAEIPVQPTRVPGSVAGRSGVFGRSHRETDPHSEGDEAAAVVDRLRRVSNLCASIFSCTASCGSERVLPAAETRGANTSRDDDIAAFQQIPFITTVCVGSVSDSEGDATNHSRSLKSSFCCETSYCCWEGTIKNKWCALCKM